MIAEESLQRASVTVNALAQAVRHGSTRLASVPGLIKQVIEEDLWHERQLPRSSIIEHYASFAAFIADGLGTTLPQLQDLCRRDRGALDAIDQVTQNPPSIHRGAFNNVKGTDAPVGNSSAYALRKLRKDRPDIHKRVLAGELSPNAGAIEAGFRQRKHQIDHDPIKAAKQLRRYFTETELHELRKALE